MNQLFCLDLLFSRSEWGDRLRFKATIRLLKVGFTLLNIMFLDIWSPRFRADNLSGVLVISMIFCPLCHTERGS